MNPFKKTIEFCDRVGTMDGDLEIDYGIPLQTRSPLGRFATDKERDALLAFCKKNPEYHIVSEKGCFLYNHYVEDAHSWFLANGDPDPALFVDFDIFNRRWGRPGASKT